MRKKINIDEETKKLLNEFKEAYNPKNKFIDEILIKAQTSLIKGQVPQVVLQRVVAAVYQIVFIERFTVGDNAGQILKRMDKLSRSNGYLPFGTLFNVFKS